VKEQLPGTSVLINGTGKPSKGSFIVTVGDKTVVSLLDMPRPFKRLRDLDMEVVAADVMRELKAAK